MIALRGAIHSGVFSSFMFSNGRLAMSSSRRGCLGTRHSSFKEGGLAMDRTLRGMEVAKVSYCSSYIELFACTAVWRRKGRRWRLRARGASRKGEGWEHGRGLMSW